MANVSRFARNTSFLHLFEKRFSTINTPRTKIQITFNIDIQSDEIIIEKIFGPFKTTMPQLNNEDMYKSMVYTAIRGTISRSHLRSLSVQLVLELSCTINSFLMNTIWEHLIWNLTFCLVNSPYAKQGIKPVFWTTFATRGARVAQW